MTAPLTASVRLAAGTAALVACAALCAIAAASPGGPPEDTARAGSATAAAVVDEDGHLVRGRGVESVHAPDEGTVCVRLAAGIAPDTVVPLVTTAGSADRPALARIVYPAAACDAAREVEVATRDAEGEPVRAGFTLVIP